MGMIRVSLEDLKEIDDRYVEMFEVLKRCEWIGMVTLKYCPSCFNWKYKGHKETCRLNDILNDVVDADPMGVLKRTCDG